MRSYLHTIALFSALLLLTLSGKGQVDSSDSWNTYDSYQKKMQGRDRASQKEGGNVRVDRPALLDSLIARYRRSNEEYPELPGYRVQLFFGDREKAEKMRDNFEEEYSEAKAYIDYLAPNFRLRVGNFRTRMDAYRFMQKLGDEFGRPYIVRTKIDPPELKIGKEKTKNGAE